MLIQYPFKQLYTSYESTIRKFGFSLYSEVLAGTGRCMVCNQEHVDASQTCRNMLMRRRHVGTC